MTLRISNCLVVGLMALLAGCGGGGGGSGSSSSSSSSGGNAPPPDTTPVTFSFASQDSQALSTAVTSNEITITGINSAAVISISGGEYSIEGGAFTSAAGTVSNNQRVRVRLTSSGQFSATLTATLTIGGVSAVFTATTLPADTVPAAFSFNHQGGQARSAEVTSNEITITGINTTAPISVTGGEYSVEGGEFTSTAGQVSNNQRVRVRLTSAAQFSAPLTATLSIGGVSADFTVTTLDADITPAPFEFADRLGAPRSNWISSASVTITGINTTTPVSVENGEYSIAGGAFTSMAGSVVAGQPVVVRVRASADYSRRTSARLTVGTVTQTFAAMSELPVYIPDAVAHDGADTVYLLNGANRRVFRWSIAESRYLESIALQAGATAPSMMVYSPAHQRLYIGYSAGEIRQIALTAPTPAEAAFATTPGNLSTLGAAGNFLVVQVGQYNYGGGFIYNSAGTSVGQGGYYYGYSRETAWDPNTQRLYYTRDGISPNDLHFDVIDQATGQVSTTGETPYHGDYSFQGPIRVSAGGQHVLLGSGDIYAQSNLNWSGSVAGQIADGRWFDNGSLVTLSTDNNQTILRRLSSSNLDVLEQRTFSGQGLRVIGSDAAMVVLVGVAGNVQIHSYIPDDDSDDDGVENTADAFPLDRAASVDSDRDGFPDAWNAGMGAADSATGLTLDAFPSDAACWLPSHGAAGICDYGATIPNYTPDQIAHHGDVVYLLSSSHRRVYRWSISGRAYLNPYVVGVNQGFSTAAPTTIAYSSAQQRLYLGYATGAIRYISTTGSSQAEVQFANAASAINALHSAGNFLAVQAGGYYGGGSIYNAGGAVTGLGGYYYGYSREAAWDPVRSRLYYMRDGISPNDLHYDVINQSTGAIDSQGESPYHGDYGFGGVVRVSTNGQLILLGTGDMFGQASLTWAGSVGGTVTDARWLANGSVVTLTTASNQSTLRRLRGSDLAVVEQLTFAGSALRVVGSDAEMTVAVLNNGTVQFTPYVPDDDSDDDGVENTLDAFPLDRAASVDSDRDGYPDSWNPGRTQADSTTGLTLDSFPTDSACWLASHGSGGVCNYGATIPNYTPDQVDHQGDIVYLLNSSNRRVYRWSISANRYLNPYVVGINQGYTTLSPTTMAYVPNHQRLYLGYPNGSIRHIDVNASSPAEVQFANAPRGVTGLANAGNFLAAHIGGGYSGGYIYSASGAIADQGGYYYGFSREMAWDAVNSRLYYTHDGLSPNDLQYDVINQTTGEITASAETPYHGSYSIIPPIRVSVNGNYVLLGSGDLYSHGNLDWAGSLGAQIADARWMADGSLTTLITASNQTTLRRLAANNLTLLEQRVFAGQAIRVVGSDAAMVVVALDNGAVRFHNYVPNNDSDNDGVSNTADAFPLDVAASVDTDNDGFPDSWNAGRSQADSTTGLQLDAFPNDSACWLSAHGSGGLCNYGATIPNYTPDQIAQQGDIIYLLSASNRRVYRWSISGGQYLNPYVVGINQGFTSLAPTTLAYVPNQQRLYLGYPNGSIRYIAVGAGGTVEVPFATAPRGVTGLANAGNYLAAHVGGGYEGGYIYNSTGGITDQGGYYYGYSREMAWDPVNSRLYYTHDGLSPNDLQYDVISQANGQITATAETPYHGDYNITPPIRVSVGGQYVLLGSGDIYHQSGLTWAGSLGGAITDARWMTDGSLTALTTSGNQATVRRLASNNLTLLEQRAFAGQALRVVGSDAAMVVVAQNGGVVVFHTYLPNNDSDNDGVLNTADAFPLDVAASVDSDHDGYPDAWNAGRSQSDSTTGLVLDAFPGDAACWLSSHGNGGVCNYGATIPNYTPDQVAQNGDVIYLLSSTNRRVYRWSISGAQYLNPYVVGLAQGFTTAAPTALAYVPNQQRLYLGYANGAIRYIAVGSGGTAEIPFTTAPRGITSLATAGNFLAAHVGGGYDGGYVYDSTGATVDQGGYYYGYSREMSWDPVNSRLYYMHDGLSPNDLQYDVINQANGQVTATAETPYHGSYNIIPPIRISVNGEYVLLGSGDIYNQNGLTWAGSLGQTIDDARWMADGSMTTITTATNQTVLRRLGASNLALLEQRTFAGSAIRVLGSDTAMVVITQNNGAVQFHAYAPNNDTDGDGVQNTADAFPMDVAASVDTDRDGYPDAWNAGRSQADSTTGLVLDAFPNDAACWLASHGSGGVCNNGATIPAYVPDQVLNNGDVIYLLSRANRRVYRWSMATGTYLNPYIVGLNQGFTTLAPLRMAFSPAHNRLYLGYENGAIRYLDTGAGSPTETSYANLSSAVYGLAPVGNFMLAQDSAGAWETHYILNSAGVFTDEVEWNHASPDFAWDPVSSRVYYFSMWSPSDLNYEVIDQTTGQITAQGETPYHGTYSIVPPIRVSPDGQRVLLGSGDIYAYPSLIWENSLGKQIKDAHWTGNILVDVDTTDRVEIRDARTRDVLQSYQYPGTPIRVLFGATETYLVHVLNNNTSFVRLPFYDADADTLPRWWEQRYGLSDSNAADAASDLDGDGLSNAAEYAAHSNPLAGDSDADGLGDAAEVNTHSTNPSRADTDGDGLGDAAEVNTHHSNPLLADSDGDGYSDLIEVQYGGDPNDVSGLPQPLTNYSQTFEGTPDLAAWTMPSGSQPWAVDTQMARTGTASLKSGANVQFSTLRFRGFFATGSLTFWARMDTTNCCNRLYVSVDGQGVQYIGSSGSWNQYSIPLTLGVRDIEWRFERDYVTAAPDAARIDDVVFTAQ